MGGGCSSASRCMMMIFRLFLVISCLVAFNPVQGLSLPSLLWNSSINNKKPQTNLKRIRRLTPPPVSSKSPSTPRNNADIIAQNNHRQSRINTSLQSANDASSFGVSGGVAAASDGPSFWITMSRFVDKNFFLVGLFFAVLSARFFPFVGVDGGMLRPELFIGKYGVGLIFLLSGLSLQTSELAEALSNMKLNGLIQVAIFVLWPLLIGLPLKGLLNTFLPPHVMPPALVDGLLIMTCLPTTVNMCIMLTSASGGNVATSICNAVFSNLAGIFVTPALLFQFFGTQIRLPFAQMVWKLCKKVLLPVAVGQGLRATPVKDFYTAHSRLFKRLQEVILLGIAWNAFCNAFSSGLGIDLRQSLILLILLPTLHLASVAGLFQLFSRPLFGFSNGEVVAAVFCASQKTLAFGLPLIQTIFEGNANLAAYCAPLMFIHPLQMTLGSLLIPTIVSKYTTTATTTETTNGASPESSRS